MRKWLCVPMMTLCLLAGCGSGEEAADVRTPYQEMAACTMTAEVACRQKESEWTALLRCEYVPGGESTVEVLEPELIAGVKAVFTDEDWRLSYEDAILNVGSLSSEKLSPALCLPRLMSALREGWLLEENDEAWNDIPCRRLALDQTGEKGGKIVSAVWLRHDDGTPLRGEISVDGEIILTAEFTNFVFCDTIN